MDGEEAAGRTAVARMAVPVAADGAPKEGAGGLNQDPYRLSSVLI